MTYKELAELIFSWDREDQNSDVTILDGYDNEFFGGYEIDYADEKFGGDIIGEGHPYLYSKNM